MTKRSLPATNPAGKHFDDDFAFLGVSPWDSDLLKLTSFLEEGVGSVDIWVWDGKRHWDGGMRTSDSLLHALLYGRAFDQVNKHKATVGAFRLPVP